jgi:hypothetical protein
MKLDGYEFKVSKNKQKKYDVYKDGKFITSFGSRAHQHYFDKIGKFSHLNHLDKKRRKLYRMRHKADHINDPTKAGYFAWRYLW